MGVEGERPAGREPEETEPPAPERAPAAEGGPPQDAAPPALETAPAADHRSALRRRIDAPPPEPMSRRNVAIFAAFIGILYAVGMIGRGEIAAGLVGGALAGVLAFLVFTEVGNRQRRRIAEYRRRHGGQS